jgi:hypothetical protein
VGPRFAVFDISDPLHPQQIGSLATSAMSWVVAVSGSFAYVGDYDSYPEPSGFHVVDISDPTNPVLVSTILGIGTIYSIAVTGSRACLTLPDSGEMAVVDITDPAAPTFVDRLSFHDYSPCAVATLATPSSGETMIVMSGGIFIDPWSSTGWVATIAVEALRSRSLSRV